jgi:transcriptional regulator with XRE-family HTH domain
LKEVFSERLKAARVLRKLAQADLAARSGLHPSAISRLESRFAQGGRSPSFDNLRRLADALLVTTDYLLGRSDHPGVSGPMTGNLFRYAENLSADNLETLESMARVLAGEQQQKQANRVIPSQDLGWTCAATEPPERGLDGQLKSRDRAATKTSRPLRGAP